MLFKSNEKFSQNTNYNAQNLFESHIKRNEFGIPINYKQETLVL